MKYKLASLVVLALAGCAKPPPPVVQAPPPPPPPVGHTYPTLVAVPPPPHKWIHVSPAQHAVLQQVFNVMGLQTTLMVGAYDCNEQDKYNAFMMAFQPHILADQTAMDRYFRRIGNRAAEDAFTTQLANDDSVTANAEGSQFCLNSLAEYRAVLALKTPQDLDAFVTDKAPPPAPAGP